jgi:uncharacterized membrane protein
MLISSNKRILVKCLTYRILSIFLTLAIVYIVTGSLSGALSIGFLDFFVKMGFQFGHEKLWKMTTWGKIYHG